MNLIGKKIKYTKQKRSIQLEENSSPNVESLIIIAASLIFVRFKGKQEVWNNYFNAFILTPNSFNSPPKYLHFVCLARY